MDVREPEYLPYMATAEDYGGPLRACIAMMMVRSGASMNAPHPVDSAESPGYLYPVYQHVQSFARHDPQGGDLETSVGAALSFSDRGQQVQFIGRPRRRTAVVGRGRVTGWTRLLEGRSNASVAERRPQPDDLTRLLRDHAARWVIKLDVPGMAIGHPEVSYQPCLVLAEQDGVLSVLNPGSEHVKAEAYQEIPIAAALGHNAVAARHASIMAVRPGLYS